LPWHWRVPWAKMATVPNMLQPLPGSRLQTPIYKQIRWCPSVNSFKLRGCP
jgi:hypothetical protein